jgi:hypothetical protein
MAFVARLEAMRPQSTETSYEPNGRLAVSSDTASTSASSTDVSRADSGNEQKKR